ncbi:MAG: hypothetical protein AB7D00_00320 [Rhodospirillaceae bacterium]
MDVTAATILNQAQLQQSLAVAALQQSVATEQNAAAVLQSGTVQSSTTASSVPAGQTGQILDILV